jgi:hypothetical protein
MVADSGPGRSIYAPERVAAEDGGLRLPQAMPFSLHDEEHRDEPEFAEEYPREEVLEYEAAGAYADEIYDDVPHDDEEPAEAEVDTFRPAPPTWIGAEDGDEEDDPLPAALLRQSRRDPEPVAHLPPLVETARGISAKTLAVAALFGLAAGVGAIATYQFSVAPVATPALAVAPTHPVADSTKIVKLDADRVPQAGDGPAIKVAAATATPKLAELSDPSAAPVVAASVAAAEKPAPQPIAPVAETVDADPAAPALRRTEDASAVVAAADVPSDAAVPSDTEPFVATASIRKAAPRAPAGGQPLAYAPIPQPNDPVGRSFFGKDGGDDAAAAPKKSATAAIPAPSPGKAKVLLAVNMRAKPDNDSPSIKILGAGARVQVVKCDGWCEVVADGKRGYIFKKFLDN